MLSTSKNLSHSTTLQADQNGYEFVVINHEKFDAAFTLHGGHLIHFQAKQQAPLIYLSKTALFDDTKAIRGGVPICWPWFGAAPTNLGENLPSHGFARTSKWLVSAINESAQGMTIEFSLACNEKTKALWPYDFALTLKAELSDHIELSLITKNTGTQDFSYRSALHSYLSIAGTENCSITGLATRYQNSLEAGAIKESDQPVTITGPIDSIYEAQNEMIVVHDVQQQRQISIENSGNDSVVIWNPWISGATAFADMPDDGYQTMLCVEAAITNKTGVIVEAGQSHTLKTVIK